MEVVPPSASLEPDMLNFIYACSICGATFADTYEGHNKTVQGLSDGINPKDRLVTKLFLSGCCHVFCVDHLQDQGVPFHPAGQKPKAPCPYCVQQKGDTTLKELYSIRGFNKDEHDPEIPKTWFSAPPMSLDSRNPEMEALRFQYLALARYCQASYRTRKPLADALKKSNQNLAAAQNRAAEERAKIASLQNDNKLLRATAHRASEVDTLRAEVQRLQYLERERNQFCADREQVRLVNADVPDLDVFRRNKTAILWYLKLLPKVVEQNSQMKERLSSLGFAMALEPVPNYTQLNSDDYNQLESIAEAHAEGERQFQKSSSTETAGRSVHTSGFPFTSSDRPLKRQRVESPLPQNMQSEAPSIRDRMPPPPSKPLSKMRSVRGLIPTIRKKLSSNRSSPKKTRKENADILTYDNGHWRDAAGSLPSPQQDLGSEPPYISGGLQLEDRPQQSQFLVGTGIGSDASKFSFRASSPVKFNSGENGHQPLQLPTAPSYLRLMDGLECGNGLELGLRDPRVEASNHCNRNEPTRPTNNTPQNQRQTQEVNSQQRWRLGHAFLHQSPNGSARHMAGPQSSSPAQKSVGFFSRAQYDTTLGIPTPEQSQSQQRDRQAQDVVSKFFECNQYETPIPTKSQIAETHTSSHRFAASQSQRQPASQVTREWRELDSLNGLSFMDSPLDSRNEPIMYKQHRYYSCHDPTPKYSGFGTLLSQPSDHEFTVDSRGYVPSAQPRLTFSRQQPTQLHSQAPLLGPLNRSSSSRLGHLPSTMPSVLSRQSPVRNRTPWEPLQRAGVRSSRQAHGHSRRGSIGFSSTTRLPRVERRSVRR